MLTWLKQPGKPRAGQDRKPLHSSTPWPWLTGTGYMLQPQPFSPSPGVLGAEHAEGYGKGMLATGALQQHRLLPCPQGHGVLAAAGVTSYHCRANRVKERDRKKQYVCLPQHSPVQWGTGVRLAPRHIPAVLYCSAWAEGDIKSCFLPDAKWDLFISHLSFLPFTPSMAPGPSASWTLITTYPAPFCPLA